VLNSQHSIGCGNGARPRRIAPLVGAMLASLALLGATASSAAAEPVGLFLAGEKSEEVAKQPRIEAEKYTASITGTGLTNFSFNGQWGAYVCTGVQLFGSASSATKELALTSFFAGCTYKGFGTTIMMNGCTFKLHVLNAGPPYTGSYDVICPPGQGIVANGGGRCTLKIPGQTGIEGISLENVGKGSERYIYATFNLTGMTYTQTQGTGLGKCTSGEFTDGTYTGEMKFTATK
jgi:hypothetical protein